MHLRDQRVITEQRDVVAQRQAPAGRFMGMALAALVLAGVAGLSLLGSSTSAPAPAPAPAPALSAPPSAGCLNDASWGTADPSCQVPADEAKRRLGQQRPSTTGLRLEARLVRYCSHARGVSDDGAPCSPCADPYSRAYSIQVRTVRPGGTATAWELDGHTCLTDADLDEIDSDVGA